MVELQRGRGLTGFGRNYEITHQKNMLAGTHVPAARGRIRRRLVVIRALKADPAIAGQCRSTLLIAREIAGPWSDHPIPEVSRAPLIAGRRLCRCRLHSAKQHRNDQEKRSGRQTHARLLKRMAIAWTNLAEQAENGLPQSIARQQRQSQPKGIARPRLRSRGFCPCRKAISAGASTLSPGDGDHPTHRSAGVRSAGARVASRRKIMPRIQSQPLAENLGSMRRSMSAQRSLMASDLGRPPGRSLKGRQNPGAVLSETKREHASDGGAAPQAWNIFFQMTLRFGAISPTCVSTHSCFHGRA